MCHGRFPLSPTCEKTPQRQPQKDHPTPLVTARQIVSSLFLAAPRPLCFYSLRVAFSFPPGVFLFLVIPASLFFLVLTCLPIPIFYASPPSLCDSVLPPPVLFSLFLVGHGVSTRLTSGEALVASFCKVVCVPGGALGGAPVVCGGTPDQSIVRRQEVSRVEITSPAATRRIT